MNYVISSLVSAQQFNVYEELSSDDRKSGISPRILHSIKIKGGAGIADKALHTPHGVVTPVSDEDLDALRKIPAFIEFEKKGFMTVETSGSEPAGDKFATAMEIDHGSAPRSFAHYAEKDESRPEQISIAESVQPKSRRRQGASV